MVGLSSVFASDFVLNEHYLSHTQRRICSNSVQITRVVVQNQVLGRGRGTPGDDVLCQKLPKLVNNGCTSQ